MDNEGTHARRAVLAGRQRDHGMLYVVGVTAARGRTVVAYDPPPTLSTAGSVPTERSNLGVES